MMPFINSYRKIINEPQFPVIYKLVIFSNLQHEE